MMLAGLHQWEVMHDTFSRYLSQEVVEALLGSPAGLQLGGEVREVTFLVSDWRGFSSLAAHLSPQAVIAILNRYFEHTIDIILRYPGTIDELKAMASWSFLVCRWRLIMIPSAR